MSKLSQCRGLVHVNIQEAVHFVQTPGNSSRKSQIVQVNSSTSFRSKQTHQALLLLSNGQPWSLLSANLQFSIIVLFINWKVFSENAIICTIWMFKNWSWFMIVDHSNFSPVFFFLVLAPVHEPWIFVNSLVRLEHWQDILHEVKNLCRDRWSLNYIKKKEEKVINCTNQNLSIYR